MPNDPASPAPLKVPVGTSTVAGYSTTLTSTILAVLAYEGGDHTQQIVGVIVAGAVALVSFAVTSIGRYWQARELARAAASAPPPAPRTSA